jgi:hypothetical protein
MWSTITSKRAHLRGNSTFSPSLRHLALHNNMLCIKPKCGAQHFRLEVSKV